MVSTFNINKKLVKNTIQSPSSAAGGIIALILIIYIALTIWAIMLAIKISSHQDRVINVFFAFINPPIYLFIYFIQYLLNLA